MACSMGSIYGLAWRLICPLDSACAYLTDLLGVLVDDEVSVVDIIPSRDRQEGQLDLRGMCLLLLTGWISWLISELKTLPFQCALLQ